MAAALQMDSHGINRKKAHRLLQQEVIDKQILMRGLVDLTHIEVTEVMSGRVEIQAAG